MRWLAGGIVAAALLSCSQESRSPSVLLVTVDTLRADHLGAYGYPLDTSPVLDALAASGVRFADCTVQRPATWSSMASMLTGLYPRTTGVRVTPRVLPESLTLLSEVFRDAGYQTAAVVANYNVGTTFNFQQGFEHFVESWAEGWLAREGDAEYEDLPGRVKQFTNATVVTDEALAWLAERSPDEPFFLWLHYMDPHGPYLPPERYADLFEGAHPHSHIPLRRMHPYQIQRRPDSGRPILNLGFYVAQYDREIRYFDDELGRLLSALRERGLRPLVALSADHGESQGEHGYYLEHGFFPYQASSRVPLILAQEGRLPAGRVVREPVGLIDLAPTLLELAGIPAPAHFEGQSLAPLALGTPGATAPEHVFVEAGEWPRYPQRAVRWGRWKLILVESTLDRELMTGRPFELYDLESDPQETRNVADEHPEIVARLTAALADWQHETGAEQEVGSEVDLESLAPEAVEMLRGLGYVE